MPNCRWCNDTGIYVGAGFDPPSPCTECPPKYDAEQKPPEVNHTSVPTLRPKTVKDLVDAGFDEGPLVHKWHIPDKSRRLTTGEVRQMIDNRKRMEGTGFPLTPPVHGYFNCAGRYVLPREPVMDEPSITVVHCRCGRMFWGQSGVGIPCPRCGAAEIPKVIDGGDGRPETMALPNPATIAGRVAKTEIDSRVWSPGDVRERYTRANLDLSDDTIAAICKKYEGTRILTDPKPEPTTPDQFIVLLAAHALSKDQETVQEIERALADGLGRCAHTFPAWIRELLQRAIRPSQPADLPDSDDPASTL